MGEIGDEWTPEEVERVYGNKSLQDALDDRKACVAKFAVGIDAILNR